VTGWIPLAKTIRIARVSRWTATVAESKPPSLAKAEC
jgi:hypothetical protein